jgi:hypothetical protein
LLMLQQNQTTQNNNQLIVPSSENVIDLMKQEIAQEFGITLGADATARDNGRVGGEITKRLVRMAQEQLNNKQLH